ncbi:MAG: sugar transferase [Longimicrobiales bacterium]
MEEGLSLESLPRAERVQPGRDGEAALKPRAIDPAVRGNGHAVHSRGNGHAVPAPVNGRRELRLVTVERAPQWPRFYLGAADEATVEAAALAAAAEVDWAGPLPERASGWSWRVQQRVKRGLDVVLSAAGLVVLSPLLLTVAALVRLTSPGPALYQWRVVGRNGRLMTSYKFRTMVANANQLKPQLHEQNEMRGPVFKMRKDPRVTAFGRFLRRSSIDELPQLWSVLKGDMSLVGPRPPEPHEFAAFAPAQRQKLSVTPGLTCHWQVNGRSRICDFDEWVQLDLQYIREWNLWVDCKILARTIPAVIRGIGAY